VLVVFAHGLVGRADLPIPAAWFGAAAAVVLAVSFAALAAGWTKPRLEDVRERPLFRIPFAVDVVAGVAGVLVFALAVYAGLAGAQVPQDNLAPTVIYIVVWVGVPVASLLLGDVFRLISPWRAVGRAGGALIKRFGGADLAEPLPYPERLGRWPAAVGIAVFAAVELCWRHGDEPRTLAILAIVYFAVQIAGMGLYGVETWTRRGDAFGVYFGLFAGLAPLARRAGRLVLRPPLAGAAKVDFRPAGSVALVLAGIGSTMFDGAKEGPVFGEVAPRLQDFFTGLGLSKGAGLELAFLIGLLAAFAIVTLVYLAGDRRRRFAHSLIPIAAAYVVAHYFSLLAYNGQAVWSLASDPLGQGDDLFGTAARQIDYGVVSATGIWYVQVAALVIGHVAGLVLAHDRAIAVLPSARDATRSQLAMLGVMVAFTVIGLWQLSVANA
jgi:hypothetical protein